MPRIIIKGGVWRNTEDEILKAAVMKYGKNQWSRIASLLHRKTAKQCKARWYEWLDPSIKKTEWSREEDEKLLHLVKLMPTQWRTIAPIVGRTANQCLERYEVLLDQAQKKAEGGDVTAVSTAASSTSEIRKLRPGEIDPHPETKPARPDPVDMDEDELEMLSEARARLANTQGKKAKRKAREKQLDEAKRLAALQKRREMRAAGLYVQLFKRHRKATVDYNADIPFEKQPPRGFHDTSHETFTPKPLDFDRLRKRDVEPESRDAAEAKERKKTAETKRRARNELPKELTTDGPQMKRSKLMLPEPQVSDAELDQVIKMGRLSEQLNDTSLEAGNVASQHLITDYAATSVRNQQGLAAHLASVHGGQTAARLGALATPSAAMSREANILREAQDLLALTNTESTLKGGENTQLAGDWDFAGVLPKPKTIQTPNVKLGGITATPRGTLINQDAATPGAAGSGTPLSVTSFRDNLSINLGGVNNADNISIVSSNFTPHEIRMRLREGLAGLPRPKNDFEIVLDDHMKTLAVENGEDTDENDEDFTHADLVFDADDRDAAERAEAARKRQYNLSLRSQVMQRELLPSSNTTTGRKLPRPVMPQRDLKLSDYSSSSDDYAAQADRLISRELLTMLIYDARENPVPLPAEVNSLLSDVTPVANVRITVPKDAEMDDYLEKHPYEQFSKAELNDARALIDGEIAAAGPPASASDDADTAFISWERSLNEFLCSDTEVVSKMSKADTSVKKDYAQRMETVYGVLHACNKSLNRRADKLEGRVNTLTTGYKRRAQAFTAQLEQLHGELQQARIEENSFIRLAEREQAAAQNRLAEKHADVRGVNEMELQLQARYDELSLELDELTSQGYNPNASR